MSRWSGLLPGSPEGAPLLFLFGQVVQGEGAKSADILQSATEDEEGVPVSRGCWERGQLPWESSSSEVT